jgi:hypothetical protein
MNMINQALTYLKTSLKLVGRWFYVTSIVCLVAAMTIVVQPFLTNAAINFTNTSSAENSSSKISIPLGRKVDSILIQILNKVLTSQGTLQETGKAGKVTHSGLYRTFVTVVTRVGVLQT